MAVRKGGPLSMASFLSVICSYLHIHISEHIVAVRTGIETVARLQVIRLLHEDLLQHRTVSSCNVIAKLAL